VLSVKYGILKLYIKEPVFYLFQSLLRTAAGSGAGSGGGGGGDSDRGGGNSGGGGGGGGGGLPQLVSRRASQLVARMSGQRGSHHGSSTVLVQHTNRYGLREQVR
jgi:hypothetical protein